jgi:hypothetical protein
VHLAERIFDHRALRLQRRRFGDVRQP